MIGGPPSLLHTSHYAGTLKRLSEALYNHLTSQMKPADRLPTAVLAIVWCSNVVGAVIGAIFANSLQ